MREIKFRAWANKAKVMHPIWYGIEPDRPDSNDYDIMQYTGLKDKNGKEIYESDFLDFNGLEYVVTFEHGGWYAKCLTTGPNPDGTESKRPDEWLFDFHELVEVIGNKYDSE
jgi:uncharacterized phage protein (TIGR01671 family)